VKQAIVPFIWCLGFVAIVGCAGAGKVIPIHLRATQAAAEPAAAPPSPLRVVIGAFEDGRQHQTGLGVRTHLWGGVTYFDVPGGKPGEAVANALAEYLRAKGWQVVKSEQGEGADVVIAGKIQECSVRAKSRVGFTEITTHAKLAIQATNRSDGSVVRMVLNGTGAEDVFWFDPDDVEAVVNEVLASSFSKLTQDTTVVNRMLRITQQ
jgi:hypothetical protein